MGHRTKAEKARTTKAAGSTDVRWPNVSPSWHPLAQEWYRSLKTSGQAAFYEPSDVQTARFVAEVMSRALNQGQRISSQLVATILTAQSDLLTTEGHRRRARLELTKVNPGDHDPRIAIMDHYRRAAGVPTKQES
jgi:hypothetical protein